MCTRAEVEHIVDKSTEDIHRHINRFEETREKEMRQIAKDEVGTSVSKVVQWVGIGGLFAIVSFIWFFSGLNSDVDYLTQEMAQVNSNITDITNFMNRGDRFTIEDGNNLKGYVDQQDAYVQRQIDTLSDGQDGIKKTLDEIKDLIRK